MSVIDKTYVNYEQFKQARQFADETKAEQIRCLGEEIPIYYTIDELNENAVNFVLWNTSSIQDIWLYQNCKLPFIQERLLEQYGEIPLVFKLVTFEQNYISLVGAISENVGIYFWYNDNDSPMLLEPTDEILVYGTTFFFKVIDNIKETICGYGKSYFDGEITINYYGIYLTYKSGIWYNTVGYDVDLTCHIDSDDIKFPKIKYSFSKSDFTKFRGELVYFSLENEIVGFDSFNGWKKDEMQENIYLGRYRIPDYILNHIHE